MPGLLTRLSWLWLVLSGGLFISCASTVPGPRAAVDPRGEERAPASGESLPPVVDRIVDYCEMRSIEEGREFRLRAVYRSGFEVSELMDQARCSPGRFWVEFSPESETARGKRALSRIEWNTPTAVIFRGSYRCGARYGHEGFYDCEFIVSAVERVVGEVAGPSQSRFQPADRAGVAGKGR